MSAISPLSAESNRWLTTFHAVAIHTLLWIVWLLGLLLWVPRVERLFRNLNIKAPSMTELVLTLLHGAVPLGLLLALVFILLDGTVYYRLRRSDTRAVWSDLMTAVPIVAIIVTSVAIHLPMVQLLEALSR